ncbi:NifU N-terminal domain-containing protein [Candidatus Microgenomates bacterium]|nr:NifU N-terminal domain-containing protein [Candidatus Microgenomates bacterium]
MAIRVIVRVTSDLDVRQYHVEGAAICDEPFAVFHQPLWGVDKLFGALGRIGRQIMEALTKVPTDLGIQEILIMPTMIEVHRDPDASWRQLENKIVEILRGVLDKDLEVAPTVELATKQVAALIG